MQALTRGAQAAGRGAWLVAPGLLVALLRSLLGWPAPLFALGVVHATVSAGLSAGLGPEQLARAALDALMVPRAAAILAGLWLAGQLASAALRVVWLSGALPTLGGELAEPGERRARFAEGVAFGFAPLLGTALLAFFFEAMAQLCALGMVGTIALTAVRHAGGSHPLAAALFGAGAVTAAVAIAMISSVAADGALARTALFAESPALALWEALRRVLHRPGVFLLAGLSLGAASAALLGSAQAMETVALGVASGAPALLVLGPRLMMSVLGAALATLLELWRLGTVAVLVCGEAPRPGG